MNTTARTVIAVAAAALAAPAFAQYQKPLGISVRAGLFFPSNAGARDQEGQTWFTVGADYKIKDLNLGANAPGYGGALHLSVDYYGKGGFNNVPVMLNYIGRVEGGFYYGLGAGIGFTRVPKLGGGHANDEDFVYGFTAGYDFVRSATPLFVEAKYFGSNESQLNGFAIVGGVRF
jgi:hypothetical protein